MKHLKWWLAGMVLLAGCAQMNVELPAVSGAQGSQLPGKVIWHDLISARPEASKAFYEALFGWQFEKLSINTGLFSSSSYYLIRHKGELVGGMVDQADLDVEGNASQWVVVFASDSVEQSANAVNAAGGQLLGPVFDLKERGQMAVARDGQGALFAMLQTPAGDPRDKSSVPVGGFLWNELWTTDVSAATDFYRRLMPYQVEHKELAGGYDYSVLKAQQRPRAGILAMPVEGIEPSWLTYLRVKDEAELDSILAKVERLGGRVLLPAETRKAGGKAALIAGPSGAGIALQTWSLNGEG